MKIIYHVDPLRRLDVSGGQGRLGQQELGLLDGRFVVHVGSTMQESGNLRKTKII
jgi:hypothetical protein